MPDWIQTDERQLNYAILRPKRQELVFCNLQAVIHRGQAVQGESVPEQMKTAI